jgi:hypothetical protein
MAIAWRNPHPVQTIHRWLKVSDTASSSAYVIQAGQAGKWADLSTSEVQDGGNVLGPRAQNRARHG